MTIYTTGKDTVLECNFCNIEVDRFKNISVPLGVFKKQHKIICDDCEKIMQTNLKIISRMVTDTFMIVQQVQREQDKWK